MLLYASAQAWVDEAALHDAGHGQSPVSRIALITLK